MERITVGAGVALTLFSAFGNLSLPFCSFPLSLLLTHPVQHLYDGFHLVLLHLVLLCLVFFIWRTILFWKEMEQSRSWGLGRWGRAGMTWGETVEYYYMRKNLFSTVKNRYTIFSFSFTYYVHMYVFYECVCVYVCVA